MKPTLLLIILSILSSGISGQNNWYVDYQNGSNNNSGTSHGSAVKTINYLIDNHMIQPKDTVFIIGQYNNPSYNPNFVYNGNNDRNNPHIWHKENSLQISNLHGSYNQYITIKAYDTNTVIKGDGANLFRMLNCSYIRIEGLELEGEVNHIQLSWAEGLITDGMQFLYLDPNTVDPKHPSLNEVLFRVTVGTTIQQIANTTYPIIGPVTRPSYIDTRGIYISNSHHIDIVRNHIHHTPGNGFRVSNCSYVNIIANDIHDCSRKSYSGTHALVVTKSEPGTPNATDDPVYTIKVLQNKVHNNYNEIFSWVGTKNHITPRIDEGKGISLQRNNLSSWINGNQRILVANNVCYWNGFSGVHSNDGWHIDFINNTCFMNSYTNSVTYTTDKRGNNIGISAQGGGDIRMINNISQIDAGWGGYPLSAGNTQNLVVRNNLVYGVNGTLNYDGDITAVEVNTWTGFPGFLDTTIYDFRLQPNSIAIGKADTNYAPTTDYYGYARDNQPDLGAIEYGSANGIAEKVDFQFKIRPNPFEDHIVIDAQNIRPGDIHLFNILGQEITSEINLKYEQKRIRINTRNLKAGIYILQIKNKSSKLIKSK